MRLIQMKLINFRCYKDDITIDFEDFTVFVGKNDSGKSSIFDALNIFFTEKTVPESDDCHVHADDRTVRITCIFEEFPNELVIDEQHPTDLLSEYLLNADGNLEISQVYKCSSSGKGKLVGVFAHANHPTTDNYNDLLTLKIEKLKQRASNLHVDLSSVNQTIRTKIRRAIWADADNLQCQEVDVELKAEAAKDIWDQLKKHLPVFALFKSDRPSTDQDAEAQDPMKAAVKEAIKEQETALDEITAEVKKEVQEIADRTVEKIREMNPELASQLTPRVSTKNWDSLFSVNLTGDEDIPINKRGSGTRRLILLNFLRARAEKEAEGKSTGIIYAVEELEASQHPSNQVMLIKAFEDLAERPDCQVFLSTHTPTLARRFNQQILRLVTQENGQPLIRYGTEEETLSEIVESLGVLPDHNIKVFLGVEGGNDINFLRTISKMLNVAGEDDILDLGAVEDSGQLVFVPLGGSSLGLWVSRLAGFNRPEFYIIDRDNEPPDEPHYKAFADEMNQPDNCIAWHTGKKELENYIHKNLILAEYSGYSGIGTDFEDVPALFAQAVYQASNSGSTWADVLSNPEKLKKKISNAKRRLNTDFVGRMTPDLLNQVDAQDDVRTWLRAVSAAIQA